MQSREPLRYRLDWGLTLNFFQPSQIQRSFVLADLDGRPGCNTTKYDQSLHESWKEVYVEGQEAFMRPLGVGETMSGRTLPRSGGLSKGLIPNSQASTPT